jgi:hypothetical protein
VDEKSGKWLIESENQEEIVPRLFFNYYLIPQKLRDRLFVPEKKYLRTYSQKMCFAAYLLLTALCLSSCSKKLENWSEVRAWKEGDGKSIGMLGLGLSRGPSGKIEFFLGPEGSVFGPKSPETEKDLAHFGPTVGIWVLEKGNTKVILARNPQGSVKVNGYENIDTEIWEILSTPGCSKLTASIETGLAASDVIVQKTYKFCDVDVAVKLLR